MWSVHKGIGSVMAAASQLLSCNGRTDDVYQLIEYSDILANEFMTLIVSCIEVKGFCRNRNISIYIYDAYLRS